MAPAVSSRTRGAAKLADGNERLARWLGLIIRSVRLLKARKFKDLRRQSSRKDGSERQSMRVAQ